MPLNVSGKALWSGVSTITSFTPGDPLYYSVTALFKFDGTNGDTTTTEQSNASLSPVTFAGAAQLSSTQAKFGTTSASFNDGSDAITVPYNTGHNLAKIDDFTMECWIYRTTTAERTEIASQRDGGGGWAFLVNDSNQLQFFRGGVTSVISTTLVPSNEWVHVAVEAIGGVFTLYINGVDAGGSAAIAEGNNALQPLNIGKDANTTTNGFRGFIDDFRITSWVARYGGNFTPPDSIIPNIPSPVLDDPFFSSVTFLSGFEGANGATSATDDSPVGNTIVFGAGAIINTTPAKIGVSSLNVNGTSLGLVSSANNDAAFDLTQEEYFTLEFWIYPTAIGPTDRSIMSYLQDGAAAGWGLELRSDGRISFGFAGVGGLVSTNPVPINTWTNVVITRHGTGLDGLTRIGINGTGGGTSVAIPTGTAPNATASFKIGSFGTEHFEGFVDEVRITKGVVRYGAGVFTPLPTIPFPRA